MWGEMKRILFVLAFVGILSLYLVSADQIRITSEDDFINLTFSNIQLNRNPSNTCDASRYLSTGYDYPDTNTNPSGTCNRCDGSGSIENVANGLDSFNECGTTNCLTGTCNGAGACGYYTSGQQNCASGYECDASGVCVDVFSGCSCDETVQAYKKYDIAGDTIYIDCTNNKCWTSDAGIKVWGSIYDEIPDNSCIDQGPSFPACDYCDNLDYGGFTDWTLPTRYTLRDLCESSSCSGTICFGGRISTYNILWSDYEYSSSTAWTVRFTDCFLSTSSKNTAVCSVRCIRG